MKTKSSWRIYAYANCSTCRRALAWAQAAGISCEVIPIRAQPPTRTELDRALAAVAGQLRRLFNTSGTDYREMRLGEKLPQLSTGEALTLLAANGNLVRRPFAVTPRTVLVGFDEAAWQAEARR